jgi:hypothetical protein
MAAPTNTATTLTTKGLREDLEGTIYRVAPDETPFLNNIGKGVKATNILHEWQTEALPTPDATNQHLEGDDIATVDAESVTARVSNYNGIFVRSGAVSRTDDIAMKAGRASEMNRQKALKGIALRTDIEKRFIGNFASNAESGGTPRRAAGINAWLTSNVSNGAGGSNGGFSAGVVGAATAGTTRTFTEALVKSVLGTAYNNGGKPDQAYMGITHKQQFGAFTGIAAIRKDVSGNKMATIVGAADLYVTDTGAIALIPHPYGMGADCLFVTPDMAAVATFDGMHTEELAKTGDAEKFMIVTEKTLVVRNEKAHAVIRAI